MHFRAHCFSYAHVYAQLWTKDHPRIHVECFHAEAIKNVLWDVVRIIPAYAGNSFCVNGYRRMRRSVRHRGSFPLTCEITLFFTNKMNIECQCFFCLRLSMWWDKQSYRHGADMVLKMVIVAFLLLCVFMIAQDWITYAIGV